MERLTEIIHSRCEEVLKELPDGSVDLLCTDPPYGVSFMGKDWDKAVPSVEIWKECLRVLKPGSFAFVMSLPRADCLARMIINLETAGFVVAFTPIFWTFASGFPKAYNIAKGVEGKLRLGTADWSKWNQLDGEELKGRIGYHKSQAQQGYRPKDYTDKKRIGKVHFKTPEAKKLEGSYAGFQPKPAVEVIIVAMKPFKGNFVDQALQTGKGITWLDDCRIPITEQVDFESIHDGRIYGGRDGVCYGKAEQKEVTPMYKTQGRFPANLLVQDDVLNDGKERISPSGEVKRKPKAGATFSTDNCGLDNTQNSDVGYGDSGSFSRYFDLDKWFQEKLGKFSERLYKTYPFLIETKASNKEKWFYCLKCREVVYVPEKKEHSRHTHFCETCNVHTGNPAKHKGHKVRSNFVFHPTVKPLKLMCYLVTMGSRKEDVVLDPFAGTCKTAMAAEVLGRQYIMIEQDEIAVKLGEAGIVAVRECSD